MVTESEVSQGTLRTVALACGSGTANHRPSAHRCGPPTQFVVVVRAMSATLFASNGS